MENYVQSIPRSGTQRVDKVTIGAHPAGNSWQTSHMSPESRAEVVHAVALAAFSVVAGLSGGLFAAWLFGG